MPDKNVRERSVSLSHANDIYNRYSGTPQPYEEYQSKQLQNEPELLMLLKLTHMIVCYRRAAVVMMVIMVSLRE